MFDLYGDFVHKNANIKNEAAVVCWIQNLSPFCWLFNAQKSNQNGDCVACRVNFDATLFYPHFLCVLYHVQK